MSKLHVSHFLFRLISISDVVKKKGGCILAPRKEPAHRPAPPQRNIQPRVQMESYVRNRDLDQALDVRNVELNFNHHGLHPYPIPEDVPIRRGAQPGDIPYV